MVRFAVSSLAVFLILAACGPLRPSVDVDLAARLGDDRTGTLEEEITEGTTEQVDFRHPSGEGECVDFSDEDLGVDVTRARLHYNADATYEGPELSGTLQARLYAAPSSGDLWDERNRVGPPVTMNLGREATRLAGTITLNEAQLQAINDRYVCWGLEVTGRDVSAADSGAATIDYTVHDLKLTVDVVPASMGSATVHE